MNIEQYIEENLPKTIRVNTKDEGKLIGLPYPYIVPCVGGKFQEMYYWDTYFTNKGLLLTGNVELARNNVNNMCYLVKKYGFMLNGNRIGYLYNSQPPFLSMMVYDIYEVAKEKEWLRECYEALETEYAFWMEKRGTDIGLNRYDCMKMPEERVVSYAEAMRIRMAECNEMSDEAAARGLASSGESGWDLTPRMREKTYEYAPADLNSLLYAMKSNLSYFANELGRTEEAAKWSRWSEERKALCRKYLKNDQGLFMDYNFVTEEQNNICSPACFYPLYCGMASDDEAKAAKDALYRIETEYGILTCEKNDIPGNYQWGYPNGWAPLQLIVVGGLLRYGYKEDALRISKKFVKLVEHCFEETGHLWEKYNIVEGSVRAINEYEMPAMLGWTFGVYTYLKEMKQPD